MMRALCRWAASRLAPPRVIYDRDGASPYLSRYYLRARPTMPDGSAPFDANGNLRTGAIDHARRFGIHLHRFHRGDSDFALHSHPWEWSFSIILSGGYFEERRQPDDTVETRYVGPGSVNVIRGDDFHRVDLADEECWTLFVTGPRVTSWSFWDRETGDEIPWRVFCHAEGEAA